MKRLLLFLLIVSSISACASAPRTTRRVAVMDFESATGEDYRKLGVGVSEWMTNFLSNASGIYVVDRQDLNRYIGAHYKDDCASLRYDRWQEIGERMDIDYFIAGGVTRLDGNFVINCRLFSTPYGQIVPQSAKEMSVKRVEDLFLATQSLSKFMLHQIRSRQPVNTPAAPATQNPAPAMAPITQPGVQQPLSTPQAQAQPTYLR